jgi:hypothetical protein
MDPIFSDAYLNAFDHELWHSFFVFLGPPVQVHGVGVAGIRHALQRHSLAASNDFGDLDNVARFLPTLYCVPTFELLFRLGWEFRLDVSEAGVGFSHVTVRATFMVVRVHLYVTINEREIEHA